MVRVRRLRREPVLPGRLERCLTGLDANGVTAVPVNRFGLVIIKDADAASGGTAASIQRLENVGHMITSSPSLNRLEFSLKSQDGRRVLPGRH